MKRSMTWNDYNQQMIASAWGATDKAAIIGMDGSQWSTNDITNRVRGTAGCEGYYTIRLVQAAEHLLLEMTASILISD